MQTISMEQLESREPGARIVRSAFTAHAGCTLRDQFTYDQLLVRHLLSLTCQLVGPAIHAEWLALCAVNEYSDPAFVTCNVRD